MNDQTQPNETEGMAQRPLLSDGLGVALPPGFAFQFHVSNEELADAIAYAFDRCSQNYVGGYTTSNTETGKVMLEHLKELLTIQRARAGFLETTNAKVSGERSESAGLTG